MAWRVLKPPLSSSLSPLKARFGKILDQSSRSLTQILNELNVPEI
ncbi:MAG: hypothetical protein ACP6IY_18270 [Promethearchaeia archaeon]